MFDTKDLEAISQEYFNIICTSEYDVTVQSKNTGHFWYLHNVTQPNANACVIFHKHKYSHPYHLHGRAKTLRQPRHKFSRNSRERRMEIYCELIYNLDNCLSCTVCSIKREKRETAGLQHKTAVIKYSKK